MRKIQLKNGKTFHLIDSIDEMLASDFIEFRNMVLYDAVTGSISQNIASAMQLLSLDKKEEASKLLFDAYQGCRTVTSTFNANHKALALCIHEIKKAKDPALVMDAFYNLGMTEGEVRHLVEDVKKKFILV